MMRGYLSWLQRLWLTAGILCGALLVPSHLVRAGGYGGECRSLLTFNGGGMQTCFAPWDVAVAEQLLHSYKPVSPERGVSAVLHLKLLQADLLFDQNLSTPHASGVYPPVLIGYVFDRYPAGACPHTPVRAARSCWSLSAWEFHTKVSPSTRNPVLWPTASRV